MTTIRVADEADERLAPYARLTEHQLRNRLDESRGMLVCESRIAIEVALAEGVEPLSLLTDEGHLDAQRDLIARLAPDVPVYVLPRERLQLLIGFRLERGPLCAMRRPRTPPVEEVLEGARSVAVLEGLVDVSNVGAVFRSAAALDVDAVLVAPTCADPYVRRAVRVSMGTVFQVPWARVEKDAWPRATIALLRERGFTCCAMALEEGALALDDPSLAALDRVALLFGCEGTGLTRPVIEACNRTVVIPMSHGVDSLNVAASSAVAFWELCHKRVRHAGA